MFHSLKFLIRDTKENIYFEAFFRCNEIITHNDALINKVKAHFTSTIEPRISYKVAQMFPPAGNILCKI